MADLSLSTRPTEFEYPVLVADIGGTNARFARIDGPNTETVKCPSCGTSDHPGLVEAIRDSLAQIDGPAPKTLIAAVAGPVTGDIIPLTNAPWVIKPADVLKELNLAQVVIINDFEAQALALPGLSGPDIEQIGGGTVRPNSTKFVLGPGTGLGAAAMIYAAGIWIPVPGEGGHVEIGPVTKDDEAIWPHIERMGGRVGAESILSGSGLPRLARAVAASRAADHRLTTGAAITKAASENDPIALETLHLFARALGRVAGDFALSLLARGGVYLTGGVTPRIDRFLNDGQFRAAFEAKAPHERLVQSIPTFIVRHPNPALEGLAAFAHKPERFAVDLSGRSWHAMPVQEIERVG